MPKLLIVIWFAAGVVLMIGAGRNAVAGDALSGVGLAIGGLAALIGSALQWRQNTRQRNSNDEPSPPG